MSLREWVESELWDQEYFAPHRLGEGVEIFRCSLSFPLVASLIDGRRGEPQWVRGSNETHTDALFRALDGLVQQYGASWFYVTDPDNALSVFEWEREIYSGYLNSWPLIEFEKNPAEQGGASFLCIGFHDREGLVVFEFECSLKITLYGTAKRMAAMLSSLGLGSERE